MTHFSETRLPRWQKEGRSVFTTPASTLVVRMPLVCRSLLSRQLRRGTMTSVLLLVASVVFSEDQVKPPPGVG